MLSQMVYVQIRKEFLAGDLVPGTRLDYKQIARRLRVSTTPVREAMAKLASEGLVDLVPRAGAVVSKMDANDLIQFYGVREAIETYAAERAATRITARRLETLAALVNRMRKLIEQCKAANVRVLTGERFAEYLASDLGFHLTIIEAGGNERLTKFAEETHVHARIFNSRRAGYAVTLVEEGLRAHEAIFSALEQRDAEQAARFIKQHIQRSLELTLQHVL